ncbi:hypothetical protein OQZ33_06980 [Pedobacter sp. MC2016-05]|uniref:hypothetical protein n=1 Tax=Pedobacter sp. MC2016-05 TaxID=2994474 RepID=UPI00224608DE|nr:hypothetical protein [Pedobacter sp. MC2016-05]MCX2474068.1 hypothetical protein [Pedobacter sp. MC2016-05]
MYTITTIYKKWRLSKSKIIALLAENNVTPVHEAYVELSSVVYLKRYSLQAKYYDAEVVEDLFKNIELRS